ncbi:MAG: phosphopyruvate hydratase [Rhodobacteraceae bacterium]|nr:MAG: phosphopyruvate hydratase [Paracoccaceae bacterium]
MSKIKSVTGREILDSRGNPTIEVEVALTSGEIGRAAVPSGASTGKHEAVELRDNNESRFHGKGVQKAVNSIKTEINDSITGFDIFGQEEIDTALIALDGTPNKSRLGANAILGTSIAIAQAAAKSNSSPLYIHLAKDPENLKLPMPMMNILNGGSHADNSLDIQEFMIIPISANSISNAIRMGSEVFHSLRNILKADGLTTAVGDEGGFAPPLKSSSDAIDYIMKAIEKANYTPGTDFMLALDCASSEYFDGKSYNMEGESLRLDQEQKVQFLESLQNRYPIVSIEDGMAEDDWKGWENLTKQIGSKCQLVGDDLFATNPQRLETGIKNRAGNAILVKYNQIGTITETLRVIDIAKKNDFLQIISHRSGETEDVSIADISVATGAGQIKTGSLSRTDRVAKYNQLLRIEESLGDKCFMSKDLLKYTYSY